MNRRSAALDVEGDKVQLTHIEKVLYPKTGFTKGNLIDYYIKISPCLLPYLKDRPITLKRYPDGVNGFFFYERNCPAYRPSWMKTSKVTKEEGGSVRYCVINQLSSLIWTANLADIELHTFLHKSRSVATPTSMVFDLDPGPPADIILCAEVGLLLKTLFDHLDLKCFVKTSGSKGLQIYVPLNTPTTYEKTKSFAHAVAEIIEQAVPGLVVSKMQKNLRRGKVLIDWSQNDNHKTTVSVYSLRAMEIPTVSTPVMWDEVEGARKMKQQKILSFNWEYVLKRVEKHGDIFAPVLTLKQKLPPLSALKRIQI